MDQNENINTEEPEAKSSFWKKASSLGQKAVESAKNFAEQTKKNIHDAQAKKYTPVTAKEFKSKDFNLPSIIEIVDNSSNREFIDDNAIGWIEMHKDVAVLHMYIDFVKKSNLRFVPVSQCNNVYFADRFEDDKFINTNNIFGKATEEKLAELEHIANYLGAKSCSVEIVEAEAEATSFSVNINISHKAETKNSQTTANSKMQSGKTTSYFDGNNTPKRPNLKWFAHDDNIKRLIEMRCSDSNSIKSKVMELKGSSSATMSKKTACAIDSIMKLSGNMSMEKQTIKEHSELLIYEVEF